MVRETIGYVELEWTCPNCGNKSNGSVKVCSSCGSPQPDNVQFQQKAHQELITNQEEIARAKIGPDIHCGFCGARNPADGKTCLQCGADLKEGAQRKAGQVVGAFQTGPVEQVACPNCGSPNPNTAQQCGQCGASLARPAAAAAPPPIQAKPTAAPRRNIIGLIIAGAAVLLVVACIVYFVLASIRTKGIEGVVSATSWERSIVIEGLKPVTKQAFKDSIPSEAKIGSCSSKLYRTQDNAEPGAKQVCGTPYTVDSGNGKGQVVKDCKYEVYKDYCDYTIKEWQKVDEVTLKGNDLTPLWPQPSVGLEQRLGTKSESYAVDFKAELKAYKYSTTDVNLFQKCQIGSKWTLNVNTFDKIISIEAPK